MFPGVIMHVLIVSQYFYPENFAINEIAYGLVNRGHKVTVLTGMPNYPAGHFKPGYGGLRVRREAINGASVIRVPILPRGRESFWLLALNYLSFAFLGSLLAPFIIRERPDVILVYQLSPLTVALPALALRLVKRIPIVLWIQDIWPESLIAVNAMTSSAAVAAIRRLAVFIYRRCRMILVQSPAYISPIRSLDANEDIRYLPNSASSYFRPMIASSDAPERQLLGKGFNVVFTGNIGSQQDPEIILAAAELLRNIPNIHWVIVGEGRLREWVANEIQKRHLSQTCHLVDWLAPERMPVLYALADALLVTLSPSCISGLTIPSKLQCYLACGRPIVGAVDGESKRIIDESGAGLATCSGNLQGLANAVLCLYGMSPQQRQSMGQAARTYYEEHFEWENLLRSLDAYLIEACECASSTEAPLSHERIPAK